MNQQRWLGFSRFGIISGIGLIVFTISLTIILRIWFEEITTQVPKHWIFGIWMLLYIGGFFVTTRALKIRGIETEQNPWTRKTFFQEGISFRVLLRPRSLLAFSLATMILWFFPTPWIALCITMLLMILWDSLVWIRHKY